MAFDALLQSHVGKFGRFQLFCLLVVIGPGILFSLNIMEIIFAIQVPEYSCKIGGLGPNATGELAAMSITDKQDLTSPLIKGDDGLLSRDACYVYDVNFTSLILNFEGNQTHMREIDSSNGTTELKTCSKWEYDTSKTGPTLVSEWDLVCNRAWLQALTKSVFLIGQFFGVITGGILSDRFGRQCVGRIAFITTILMRVIMTFNPLHEVYLAARLVNGASDILFYNCYYILCSEILSPNNRPHAAMVLATGNVIGSVMAPVIAWVLPNWKYITLANTVIGFILCLPTFILPESPRWLYFVGKHEKAKETLKWMAKMNKRDIPAEASNFIEETKDTIRSPGCCFFIKSSLVTIRLVASSYIWFAVSMIFYGLTFNVGSLAGNIYINGILMSLTEIPGNCFIFFIVNSPLGRRFSIFITILICFIALFTDVAFDRGSVVRIALALIGKLSVNIAFTGMYVLTPELFPTGMRSTALGLSSGFARIGSSISPFITMCPGYIPMVFFGLIGVLASLCVLALPETKGKPFPSTVEDMHRQRSLLCPCMEKNKPKNEDLPTIPNYT